jgi:uncharacterized glyoxalase superfamily protein PhnB
MNARKVVPILNVSDIAASFAWFAKLGWEKAFQWPDTVDQDAEPDFGGVRSAECEIFLCRDGQGSRGRGTNASTGGPGSDQRSDKGVWMAILVKDPDAVYERCLAEGLEVTLPVADQPWGIRELHVRHPEGHVLRIGRAIDD